MRDYAAIVEAARLHYENLKTDINNSKDRAEHIRLTALANEAHHLYTSLFAFQMGLVYSHTNLVNGLSTGDLPDLPEFKSPYNPDA